MRCLERNKKRFYYCQYLYKTAVTDSQGYSTGEYAAKYGDAILTEGNISPASGVGTNEIVGISGRYSRTIVLDDPIFPMEINDVLFVDKEPEYDANGSPIYDYVVKGVARSLNFVSYSIEKVDAP